MKMQISNGAIAAIILTLLGCGGQPLSPWHTEKLTQEFTASDADTVTSFEDYLDLENRLFEELESKVYSQVATGPD